MMMNAIRGGSVQNRRTGLAVRRLERAGRVDESGMAATEFALILPILTTIFFGMLEVSDAMMANRRVVNAANALVDLVGQEKEVTTQEVEEIFQGVMNMLGPNADSSASLRLVSVTIDPDDNERVIVEWSREWSVDEGGQYAASTPYPVDAEYYKLDDISIIQSGVSLVVSELTYSHESGLTSWVLGSPITFDRTATRWPRRSTRVKLCTPDGSTCW